MFHTNRQIFRNASFFGSYKSYAPTPCLITVRTYILYSTLFARPQRHLVYQFSMLFKQTAARDQPLTLQQHLWPSVDNFHLTASEDSFFFHSMFSMNFHFFFHSIFFHFFTVFSVFLLIYIFQHIFTTFSFFLSFNNFVFIRTYLLLISFVLIFLIFRNHLCYCIGFIFDIFSHSFLVHRNFSVIDCS